MQAQIAKMQGNEGLQANTKAIFAHKAKMKEMKAHETKMKRNEGPKGQKLENGAGPGAARVFV